jgi:large subunit ribosomal protein L23
MKDARSVVRKALITEKGTVLREVRNQYHFEVARDANKIEIRHAVEKLWNVSVVDVRTCIVRGKEKRVNRYVGRKPAWKKAIVTLAAGQNVEFFEGV